ncbi:MAG: hypothetical protein WCK77_08555 [Verrucomicrobiota bacterium]
MSVKPLTISIVANVVLTVWLLALYAGSGSGGGGGNVENIGAREVRDRAVRPIAAGADGARRPTQNQPAAGGIKTVPPIDPKMYHAPLVSVGGLLTTGAAKAAGIDSNERVKVQAEIDKTWDDFEVSTSRRAVLNTKLSDAAKGVAVFDLPADEDRGAGIRADLSKRLEGLVGKDRMRILMDSLANTDAFGGLGSFDVRLRFLPPDPDQGTDLETVEYIATDPVSGKRTESATMTLDMFKQLYGGAFVLDAKAGGGGK